MLTFLVRSFLVLVLVCVSFVQYVLADSPPSNMRLPNPITPKIMIISMWTPEAQVWYDHFPSSGLGNLTSTSVSSPGFSMLFSSAYCTDSGSVCQFTVGEGEINSAASMMALVLSREFDFSKTYFLFAGIGGVNPKHATLGSVALARYAVQVALQYEIDPRSLPSDWPTGYISYGRSYPLEYPCITYGTEVFELNENLRDAAFTLASRAKLADEDGPRHYREKYAVMGDQYSMAARAPSIVKCDSATSDVYYSGRTLAQAFENTTALWTNGTGVYCMSAQEENAALEVMVRAAIEGIVDFSRIIVMRTGSNFDRPPPGLSDWEHLTNADQNGFQIALDNIYNAGIEIVRGILTDWKCKYKIGVAPTNYIGDIFGSLGGHPDFGFGSLTNGKRVDPVSKRKTGKVRDLARLEMERRGQFGRRAFTKV